ncbi:uridine monophosphate kinase [Actinacidiphila sp. bgisy160]|uniref:uridine monophosphate kinase n=1 Tax=Actinacidiphila sp. bgisy160 TaxID=3413796 RepID=UPI003D7140CE
MADEVASVHDLGVQIAVVVGGGNYFRGTLAGSWGLGRGEADEIGMLGTVMNALMLRGALTARGEPDVGVMTAVAMQSIAEPFIRLRADRQLRRGRIVLLAGGTGQPFVTADYAAVQRALELSADALLGAKRGVDGVYDSDPKTHPDAKRYAHLTYREAIERKGEGDGHRRFRAGRGTEPGHARLRRRGSGRHAGDLRRARHSAPGSPLPDVRRGPAGFS